MHLSERVVLHPFHPSIQSNYSRPCKASVLQAAVDCDGQMIKSAADAGGLVAVRIHTYEGQAPRLCNRAMPIGTTSCCLRTLLPHNHVVSKLVSRLASASA